MSLPIDRIETYHKQKNNMVVNKHGDKEVETYDYIVIGAGSAGSVVASRLSEHRWNNVLLLEAGGSDNDLNIKIPALFAELFNKEFDWFYHTVPQIHSNNISVYIPRGKVLGGSSSMNAMLYVRGTSRDYDNWEKLGHKGWSWKDVLPYFKKSEQHSNPNRNKTFHGSSGKWIISSIKEVDYVERLVYNAFKKIHNLKHIEDFNAVEEPTEGASFHDTNVHNGNRFSLADAFLGQEVLERSNLYIYTHAHVKKIIFDESKRAIGVEVFFQKYNKSKTIYVKKEIILSAGAINSPQILQLSGIGDEELLNRLNITIVYSNSQVGQNFHDHICVANLFQLKEPLSLHKYTHFPYNIIALLQNLLFGKGPLATANVHKDAYYHSSVNKKEKSDWPDMQLTGLNAIFRRYYENFDNIENGGYTLGHAILNPKGRGYVAIQSNNFKDKPLIDPKIYENKDDYDRMLEAFLTHRDLPNYDEDLKRVTKGEFFGGDKYETKEDIENYIKNYTSLLYHPVGTCSMGTVVDERLRVKGVTGLRVVDASIMPVITRANTNAPTVMIAEKASDMIQEDTGNN